jgi:uncharacterized membrane protein YhaH (DUF805 family)
MKWFLKAVRNYVGFSGRAQRAEYWWFALVYVVIYMVLLTVDVITGTYHLEDGYGLLSGLMSLALLLPSIAVTVRRLHDTDHSGWWLLIPLVPIVGGIVLLVFLARDGTRGANRFGPDPKAPLTDKGLLPA